MPIPEYVRWLRSHVGAEPLWLVGAAAVVLREIDGRQHVLLVHRADDREWAPVTGIVDPGEEPYVTAVRECWEEALVVAEVERLVWVHVGPMVTYDNGDRAQYLEHTFRCRWVRGEGQVGDDESLEVKWWPVDDLPAMEPRFGDRITVAVADAPGVLLGRGGHLD